MSRTRHLITTTFRQSKSWLKLWIEFWYLSPGSYSIGQAQVSSAFWSAFRFPNLQLVIQRGKSSVKTAGLRLMLLTLWSNSGVLGGYWEITEQNLLFMQYKEFRELYMWPNKGIYFILNDSLDFVYYRLGIKTPKFR